MGVADLTCIQKYLQHIILHIKHPVIALFFQAYAQIFLFSV